MFHQNPGIHGITTVGPHLLCSRFREAKARFGRFRGGAEMYVVQWSWCGLSGQIYDPTRWASKKQLKVWLQLHILGVITPLMHFPPFIGAPYTLQQRKSKKLVALPWSSFIPFIIYIYISFKLWHQGHVFRLLRPRVISCWVPLGDELKKASHLVAHLQYSNHLLK